MASVQELIAASQAQRSPFISLLEGAAGGFGKTQDSQYENALRLIKIDQERLQQEEAQRVQQYQAQKRAELQAQQRQVAEQQTNDALNMVGEKKAGVTPTSKLEEINIDDKGNPSYKIRTLEGATGAGASTLTAAQFDAISTGDPATIKTFFPNGVPESVARMTFGVRGQKGVEDRFSSGEDRKDQAQKLSTESNLRDKFSTQSKDFQNVSESYQRVLASADEPSSAGDMALIFNYMKLLDPGSTVREGEFAAAAASGSFGDRIQAQVMKIGTGKRLAPSMRADFVARSEKLFKSQETLHGQREGEFSRIAADAGANPKNVLIEMRPTGRTREDDGGAPNITGEAAAAARQRRIAELRAKQGKQ